jgi:hypothetical protein
MVFPPVILSAREGVSRIGKRPEGFQRQACFPVGKSLFVGLALTEKAGFQGWERPGTHGMMRHLEEPMKILTGIIFFLFITTAAQAQDCWLSLNGAGQKDGSASEHAYAALDRPPNKFAQKCWEQTSADGTMHVLEGRYEAQNGGFWQLKIKENHTGPAAGGTKKLKGEGKVELVGPRPVPYSKNMPVRGDIWLEFKKKARNVEIENFHIARVESGITAVEGGNTGLTFRGLHFEDTRQNILIHGHPFCTSLKDCPAPQQLSKNILIEDVNGIRYSKRHVRLSHGLSQVQVKNSHADSQFLDGDFAVGFDVENPAWDIEFRDSTSRGNLYSGEDYWNGDGFKAETETRDIRWIGCSAFDNADAGFDIKTENASLENITALRNSRNIRIWKSAVLKTIEASDSKTHGGISTQAGIWSVGPYECHHCTLRNNAIQIHAENPGRPFRIQFYDSHINAAREGEMEINRLEEGIKIDWVRTTVR